MDRRFDGLKGVVPALKQNFFFFFSLSEKNISHKIKYVGWYK